jgi:gliding motility-associated-like protein
MYKSKKKFSIYLFKVCALFISVCCFAKNIQSQNLYSAVVDSATGKIKVSWEDSNPGSTLNYIVNWGSSSIVITGSQTVPKTENTFLITSVDGNSKSYYIEIKKTVVGNTILLDNFYTIFLEVHHIGVIYGSASISILNWNTIKTNLAGDYFLDRYEAPNWRTIKKIPYINGNQDYTCNDTISYPFCDYNDVYYRIRFKIKSAVFSESVSNVGSNGPFRDNTPPTNARNDTVSIKHDQSGYPVLGWSFSASNDIAGYQILRSDIPSTGFFPIDTVSSEISIYTDTTVNACETSYIYSIVAIDKCGKMSTASMPTKEIQTILLTIPNIDPCEKKATLNWNRYINMPEELGGYKIYRKQDNGPYSLIKTLGAYSNSFSDVFQFKNGSVYTYFVKAFAASGSATSSSCEKSILYKSATKPDTLYISQVSVEADEYIQVGCIYSPVNTLQKLLLQRLDTIGGNWFTIDSLSSTTGNYLPQTFTMYDRTAEVKNLSYLYRLVAIDSCKAQSNYSINTSNSILLGCKTVQGENMVSWNSYGTWLQGVDSYDIFRQVDDLPVDGDNIGSVTTTSNYFADSPTGFAPNANVCYWEVAKENNDNPLSANAFSVSNKCCRTKATTFNIPNAFRPDGVNNLFRPLSNSIISESFTMIIYNKWGQAIFKTSDYINGWDGTMSGEKAPAGVYTYVVNFQSISGEKIKKIGTVALIR